MRYLDFKLVLPVSQLLVGFKILFFIMDTNHSEPFLSLNITLSSPYLGPYLLKNKKQNRAYESFIPKLKGKRASLSLKMALESDRSPLSTLT